VGNTGFEPVTSTVCRYHSTPELIAQPIYFYPNRLLLSIFLLSFVICNPQSFVSSFSLI